METSQLRKFCRQSHSPQHSQFALIQKMIWLRSRLHQYLRFTTIPMTYGTTHSGKLVTALVIPALSIPVLIPALLIGGTAVTASPEGSGFAANVPRIPSPSFLDKQLVAESSALNPPPPISEITIKPVSGRNASGVLANVSDALPHTPINLSTEWTTPELWQQEVSQRVQGPVTNRLDRQTPPQLTPSQLVPSQLKPQLLASRVVPKMELQEISPTNFNFVPITPPDRPILDQSAATPKSAEPAVNLAVPSHGPTNNSTTITTKNPTSPITAPNAVSPLAQSKPAEANNSTNSSTITITPANSAANSATANKPTANSPTANPSPTTQTPSSSNPSSNSSNSGGNVPIANISPQTSVLVTPSAQNTGLEPVQTLVVPTTPSQVRLERVQKITLKEAIELVGRTQRDIIQARIAVEKARGVVQEAEAAKNPTVSGNVTYNFNDSAQTRLSNIANGLRSSTISQPIQGTVGVQYTVFDSGVNDTNVRIAVQTLRTAEADLNRISQVAYLNVATAYYSLQNADGTVTIYEKQVENNERSLKDTKARERAGVGTKFDVLQSEVQLANARQDLLNAQVNQANARRELARLLAYVPTLDIAAADEIKPVDPWDKPVEETILLALRNRSELDSRRLEREIARERANLSISRTGPQVSLFANYNLADDFNTIGGFAMGYQLGARLDFTIFDGGKAQAQVRQFKADQALAESRFEQDARQARFDVESSYNTMMGRRQQIETAEKGLKQAEDALRLSRLRLSAGVGTQLEVISAENDLTRARVNRLQAITGYNQARANLERSINGMPSY